MFFVLFPTVHGSLVTQDLDSRDTKSTNHKAKKIKMSPSHEPKHKVELEDHPDNQSSLSSEGPARKDAPISNNNAKNKKRYLR